MTQTRCDRCEEWYEPEEEHDWQHLRERQVEALERIASSLETLEDSWLASTR